MNNLDSTYGVNSKYPFPDETIDELRELLGEVVKQNKTHFDHRQRYPDWIGLMYRIQKKLEEK